MVILSHTLPRPRPPPRTKDFEIGFSHATITTTPIFHYGQTKIRVRQKNL